MAFMEDFLERALGNADKVGRIRPKNTERAMIMPLSTLLISLRYFFRVWEALASEASASLETSLECGSW